MTTFEASRPKPATYTPVPQSGTTKRMRRDEIVEHATRLFAERGYDGASMADLAERVGLRKASLFHHFASKDVLYEAVLGRLFTSMSEAVMRALTPQGSLLVRLDALSDALTTALWEQPFTARLLVREAMDWGPVIREKLQGSITDILETATAFVKAGQDAGLFTEGDPRHLVVSLAGVHFMPFLVPNVLEPYLGVRSYEESFLEARKAVVREHVRAIALKKKS